VIVRILGEGQLDVGDLDMGPLNELDDKLQSAVELGDEEVFRSTLASMLDRVRQAGRPVPDESLVPSDLVLPRPDADIEEVRALLGDEGLIPG